jgi:hypothetical protein
VETGKPNIGLNLSTIEVLWAKALLACKHRIIPSLKRSHYPSFKARWQLSLFMKTLRFNSFEKFAFGKESISTLKES